ncbi:MAG: ornithine--oxo-acid transaminase [Candidatus Diapherotrites archaeon CG08_land_8_20_14_0_20_34_12]|nr:MAG: ornithine--oxo-acid transaminase [Candidatus Diapherotrites archaeon CG08_land_8_20_14_0_20_34_12]
MVKSDLYIQKIEKYVAHNYHPLPIVISRAKGCFVWDVDGNKYLDMLASYSALNQGHCNRKVIKAAKKQLDKLTLTSRAFHNDLLGEFAEKLCKVSGFDMILPMNSGAEAVETALKLARKWGYDVKKVPLNTAEIIVCEGNFHGRTTTIVGFSSEKQYKQKFGPYAENAFKLIPYNNPQALENAITENTVAFLVEPIQGEGGIIIPDSGYLKAVYDICKKHNVLLLLDEIQTGFGRTGKLFAYQHEEGVNPDILIMGKALSAGIMPISAIAARKELMLLFIPGDHGSTFGGNPLACAVGLAALDVIVKEKLVQKSKTLGEYFLKKLRTLQSRHIKKIRGKGLFIGIEIKTNSGKARPFCERLMKEGLLCKETHDQVIRLAPPLIITKKELDWAFERIKKVLCE